MGKLRVVVGIAIGTLCAALAAPVVARACSPATTLAVSPASGAPGSQTTVIGGAFAPAPGGSVTLRWGSTTGPVLATTTQTDFRIAVTIPADAPAGPHYIEGTDGTGTIAWVQATFTVLAPVSNTTAPAPPAPTAAAAPVSAPAPAPAAAAPLPVNGPAVALPAGTRAGSATARTGSVGGGTTSASQSGGLPAPERDAAPGAQPPAVTAQLPALAASQGLGDPGDRLAPASERGSHMTNGAQASGTMPPWVIAGLAAAALPLVAAGTLAVAARARRRAMATGGRRPLLG